MSEREQLPHKILTAIDGSDEALRAAKYAIGLAKVTGAKVIAVHVILLPQYVSDDARRRLRDELASKGEAALNDARKAAEERAVGIECRTLDTDSSVVSEICATANQLSADLIVMGTRGTGGVAKLMLGSVAGGVANNARCPVLVVR